MNRANCFTMLVLFFFQTDPAMYIPSTADLASWYGGFIPDDLTWMDSPCPLLYNGVTDQYKYGRAKREKAKLAPNSNYNSFIYI